MVVVDNIVLDEASSFVCLDYNVSYDSGNDDV